MEGTAAYRADEYVAAETLDVAMRHYAPAPVEKVLPFITQLAGAIDVLAGDSVRAARMGTKAAARARSRYSAAAALDALELLYGRLVPRINPGSRPTGRAGRRPERAGEAEDSVRRPAASRAS